MAPDRGTCVHVAVTSQCPAIPTSDAPVPVVNRNKYVVETREGLGCDSSLPPIGEFARRVWLPCVQPCTSIVARVLATVTDRRGGSEQKSRLVTNCSAEVLSPFRHSCWCRVRIVGYGPRALRRVFLERAGNARLTSSCRAESRELRYSVPCSGQSKIPQIRVRWVPEGTI